MTFGGRDHFEKVPHDIISPIPVVAEFQSESCTNSSGQSASVFSLPFQIILLVLYHMTM